MPVTAERRAFITREEAIDTQVDTNVRLRHIGARDTGDEPRVGYWDLLSDATALNSEGFNLLKVERRRFAVTVQGVLDFSPGSDLDFTQQVPTVTLVDEEHKADGDFLVTRIELDLDAETTTLELFG